MTISPDADTHPPPDEVSREAVDALVTFYVQNGAAAGASDLLAVGEDDGFVLVGTAALILLTIQNPEGVRAISGVVITVGPDVDERDAQASVQSVMQAVLTTRWPTPPTQSEIDELLARVRVYRTGTFTAEALVDVVRRVPADGDTVGGTDRGE